MVGQRCSRWGGFSLRVLPGPRGGSDGQGFVAGVGRRAAIGPRAYHEGESSPSAAGSRVSRSRVPSAWPPLWPGPGRMSTCRHQASIRASSVSEVGGDGQQIHALKRQRQLDRGYGDWARRQQHPITASGGASG